MKTLRFLQYNLFNQINNVAKVVKDSTINVLCVIKLLFFVFLQQKIITPISSKLFDNEKLKITLIRT